MFVSTKWVDSDQVAIIAEDDSGKISCVPVDEANTDYQEIMRLVDAGELTIQEPE